MPLAERLDRCAIDFMLHGLKRPAVVYIWHFTLLLVNYVYKMRLRADPHRSQITDHTDRRRWLRCALETSSPLATPTNAPASQTWAVSNGRGLRGVNGHSTTPPA